MYKVNVLQKNVWVGDWSEFGGRKGDIYGENSCYISSPAKTRYTTHFLLNSFRTYLRSWHIRWSANWTVSRASVSHEPTFLYCRQWTRYNLLLCSTVRTREKKGVAWKWSNTLNVIDTRDAAVYWEWGNPYNEVPLAINCVLSDSGCLLINWVSAVWRNYWNKIITLASTTILC